ncbi:MAG TPA: STAS domain-containing protein [Baekduia sp.]|nr:STAS domain-containing protein [Baekduia sp.]
MTSDELNPLPFVNCARCGLSHPRPKAEPVCPTCGDPAVVVDLVGRVRPPRRPADGLECRVEPDRDRVFVRLAGELDVPGCTSLDLSLEELHEAGFQHVIVDLRAVSKMDLFALRLLEEWTRRGDRSGTRVEIIAGAALSTAGMSVRHARLHFARGPARKSQAVD